MAALILPGSRFQSQPRPDIDFQQFFALPAAITEDLSDEDWEEEMRRMFRASQATHKFVQGQLAPEDYQDALADLGHNPYALEQFWSEGGTFSG
jgi:hypothetical protein